MVVVPLTPENPERHAMTILRLSDFHSLKKSGGEHNLSKQTGANK